MIHETDTEYQYARVIEYPDGDAHARAQRGPGDPLALPARHACSPAATGTASSSPRSRVRRDAAARGSRCSASPAAPTARAYARYFPARVHRRGRDRRRAVRHRAPLLRPAPAAAAARAHRGRAAVPAPHDRALRRRSSSTPTASPTSRSTSTTKEFFELARDRLAPGGVGDHQRRPPRGLRPAREGAHAPRWARRSPYVARDPIEPTNTLADRLARAPIARRTLLGARIACPPELRAARARAAGAARAAAARRRRLHRRPGAGRVAGRQVDRRVRRARGRP